MAAIFRHKHLNILKHNSTNKRIWYTRNTRIYKMKYKPQYGNISFFNYMHLMLSAKKFWYVRWKFRKVTKSEIICNSELNSYFMRELRQAYLDLKNDYYQAIVCTSKDTELSLPNAFIFVYEGIIQLSFPFLLYTAKHI